MTIGNKGFHKNSNNKRNCWLVICNQRFKGAYCLCLQGSHIVITSQNIVTLKILLQYTCGFIVMSFILNVQYFRKCNTFLVTTTTYYNNTHNLICKHSIFAGKDFWTGGLNPGLLWIWSNSARPVASNSTTNPSNNNSIRGNGRCLKLAYNPTLRGYEYQGSECSVRASYICEYEENSTSRALERIQKSLKEKSPDNEQITVEFW